MKLLITAATAGEMPLDKAYFESLLPANTQVTWLCTGVGMLYSAVSLTAEIIKNKPNLVVQIGIAGSFNSELPLGTVVIVENECLPDTGVEEGNTWKDLFKMGLLEPNDSPFSQGELVNRSAKLFISCGMPLVKGGTVNQITANACRKAQILDNYPAIAVESMEGAALHFVGNQFQIPYLQLRAISNEVGERDKEKWRIRQALDELHVKLATILQTIDDLI